MAAYAIQFRRGNTTQHNSFTGLLGEVTVDTDKKTLVVHDGSTTGGFPLAREGAASNASSGSFTSNVTIGGTLAVTSTASFSDDVSITGDLGMTGHIIPSANITYDLGSPTMMWRDIYVGPGSLYVNGKKVIEDNNGSINFTTDANETLKLVVPGATGTLQFSAGSLQLDGEINAITGDITFGDHLDMNSNRIKNVSAPVDGADSANKTYVDTTISSQLSGGTLAVDATTGDFSGDVAIGGSLTVTGTVTTVNSETIELADNILLLNSNALGNASQNAGLEVERGDDLNVQLLWDETNNRWSVGAEDFKAATFIGDLTGDVTGTVSSIANHDSDDLSEGTANRFYTSARQTAIEAYADSAEADAKIYTDNREIAITSAYQSYADQAEVDAKAYTDTREAAITTAYQSYADQAESDAEATAEAKDALRATAANAYADQVEVDAKAYTDTRETAITTAYQSYADTAQSDAEATAEAKDVVRATAATAYADQVEVDAKAYTDTRETAITTAYQSYADTAEVDAKAYTDTRETAITTAYQSYADTAEVDAKAYTDTRETAITTAYEAYADQVEVDAKAYADTKDTAQTTAITTAYEAYADQAEVDAKAYTDTRETAITTAYTSAISTAVAGKDNTDEITEGSTNLYFTDTRADARVANATGVNLDLGNKSTSDLSEGTNQYFTNARAVAAVEAALTHFHSSEQEVSATVATANATASVSFTFSELVGADHYAVYLNRMLLRPGEFTVSSGSTNNLTISTGVLDADDEIEVVGIKIT